jgi:flagellar basal-body rod protein FlgB
MAGDRHQDPWTGSAPGTSMDLFDTTQLGLERALSGSALRQEAIASNIANVNTPGYRRQDVDFQSALRAAWNTDPSTVERVTPAVGTDPGAQVRQDGSSVDIDVEAAAQAKNGLEYEAVAQVMKTRIAILRSAMGVQ